jgi:hypothetical protein
MIRSLRAVGEMGTVYVVCLDLETYQLVRGWRELGVRAIRRSDVERAYPLLKALRRQRRARDYMFTLTPWCVRYVADHHEPESGWLVYLDADLWFVTSIERLYQEVDGATCALVPNDWANPGNAHLGTYNVGWVPFRLSPAGRELITWWGEQCATWCMSTPEGGRYADQGYLDDFTEQAEDVVVVHHRGANVAPWNLGVRRVVMGVDGLEVAGQPLLWFHFHALVRRRHRFVSFGSAYQPGSLDLVRAHLYEPYVRQVREAEVQVGFGPGWPALEVPRDLRHLRKNARLLAWELEAPLRSEAYPVGPQARMWQQVDVAVACSVRLLRRAIYRARA